MRTTLTIASILFGAGSALAQPAAPVEGEAPPPESCCDPAPAPAAVPPPVVPAAPPVVAPAPVAVYDEEPPRYDAVDTELDAAAEADAPPDKQLLHGFRVGYGLVLNYDQPTREGDMSIKDELGLKSRHSMLLGYEAFYRVVGQDWLNVILVGNVTVAGLEQSKFIPTASGLIGAEFNESFQLGVGVNLVPDDQAPTHMIAAAGWTPKAGKIHTPVHFFFVPDAAGNHRTGVTVGVNW